jgi:hypothetical protein
MSAAELKELRKETKKYIDHEDERVLKMVFAMLEADAGHLSYQLTPEQESILDGRMAQYEQGLTRFSTWNEAKARIISKRRDVI